MSKNIIDENLLQSYMKREIETKIKLEEKNQNLIIDPLLQKYYLQYQIYDYLYPFCLIFKSDEKIPDLDMHFRMNYRYMYKMRYDFLNLLNKKYQKYLTTDEIKKLSYLEEYYYKYNLMFLGASALFGLIRPFKKLKILNLYFMFVFLLSAKYNSVFLIRKDIIHLRNKVSSHSMMRKKYQELFDETSIPDWRCYLYYYKLL